MKTLAERCQNIWNRIIQTPSQAPTRVTIRRDHVDEREWGQPFQPNEHYFQVRINEMYLTKSREWFSQYAPMVFVVTEFMYDKREEAVPFIVGPIMMEQFGQELPANMVFSDTRVSGLHPYRGGRLSLSVILYQVLREDYARNLLRMVEGLTNVLNFSFPLSSYVKVANVALDGFETILGMKETVPLVGWRREFDPDAGDKLEPSYFALINMPASQIDPNTLWVRDHQLYYGQNSTVATPFRQADFVLYSIAQTPERSDLPMLSFYPLYEQVAQEAMKPDDISWKGAKANLVALAQKMILSPDLTTTQADKLTDQYAAKIDQRHKKAVDWSALGPPKAQPPSEIDKKLRQAVKLLDL